MADWYNDMTELLFKWKILQTKKKSLRQRMIDFFIIIGFRYHYEATLENMSTHEQIRVEFPCPSDSVYGGNDYDDDNWLREIYYALSFEIKHRPMRLTPTTQRLEIARLKRIETEHGLTGVNDDGSSDS